MNLIPFYSKIWKFSPSGCNIFLGFKARIQFFWSAEFKIGQKNFRKLATVEFMTWKTGHESHEKMFPKYCGYPVFIKDNSIYQDYVLDWGFCELGEANENVDLSSDFTFYLKFYGDYNYIQNLFGSVF